MDRTVMETVLENYVRCRSRQAEPKGLPQDCHDTDLWEGVEASSLGTVFEELGYEVRNQGKNSVIGKWGRRSVNA